MNRMFLAASSTLTLVGLGLAGTALARQPSGVDFSESTALVVINNANVASETILRQVEVVCPFDGFLVARVSASFTNHDADGNREVVTEFGIARNAPSFAATRGHNYRVGGVTEFNGFAAGGGQRVDACRRGEPSTYYFIVLTITANDESFAEASSLIVEFFGQRI